MIGPWEILLRYKQNPEGDSLELTRNMAIVIAEDIEKYCTGLDRLEAENERLRAALSNLLMEAIIILESDCIRDELPKLREATKQARAALNPEVKK